jgi:small subunit ribosomal protein S1
MVNVMISYASEGALLHTQRNIEYTSSAEGLKLAYEQGIILEGIVELCDHNLNLHLKFPCGIHGVIPKEEALYTTAAETAKDIAILTRVGRAVCFKIIGFKNGEGALTAILSRRSAQLECTENYISKIIPGDIIAAKVTHIEGFGAFVDIGCGIISLLSIDAISISRIAHPSERLSVGDNVYTVVKGRDELGRICVSMRELLGTWRENAERFSEGETVGGIIRGVEGYGIFVELTPNLAGLAEYKENVRSGQRAAVYIKSIIPEKMKLKLIIIDSCDESPKKIPINYFIDPTKVTHIDHWTYSPTPCRRLVESVF